jgi:multidrug efflux pump
MVPLGTLVKLREIGGPIAVMRYNLYNAASINGNIQTGFSTGEAIQTIQSLADQTLPLSMKAEWTELMYLQLRAGNTAFYVFLLSIVSVFLALSALYESWSLPLAVILVVPLCLLCSVAGVRYSNRDVNIFVQIGLVVLVGLACKNAILIVEYAKQLMQGRGVGDGHSLANASPWYHGRSIFEATVEASRLRLRPILMTSFAFILGVVPLMVAAGAGAEMRRSLGTAVFNGMLGVTLFGIFLTPVFFYVIQGVGETRLFTAEATRWIGSCLAGGLVGLGTGYLLGRLGMGHYPWPMLIGASTGIVLMVAVLSFGRKIRPASVVRARVPSVPRQPEIPHGVQKP